MSSLRVSAIPLAAVLFVAAACGGGGAGGTPSAAGPGSEATQPPQPPGALPTPGTVFGVFVGEATVTLNDVTYRFSTTLPEVDDMTDRSMCFLNIFDQIGISAPGIDVDGEPTDPDSFVLIQLSHGAKDLDEEDVQEEAFRMGVGDALYTMDRSNPGTWETERVDTNGRASGQVNLQDSFTRDPVGSATFEFTCTG